MLLRKYSGIIINPQFAEIMDIDNGGESELMEMINSEMISSMVLESGFFKVRILSLPGTDGAPQKKPYSSVILTGLSYHTEEKADNSTPECPHGLIAPFARRNHYKAAVIRLKNIAVKIREITGIRKQDIRIFSNSSLPEKGFASKSGFGFYGKNSLINTAECGSLFIIAGLILPLHIKPSPVVSKRSNCGLCTACIDKCPVQAITDPGIIDRKLCLQGLATTPGMLSNDIMKLWGKRIYGCQTCQDVCPLNKAPLHAPKIDIGETGASVPIDGILRKGLSGGMEEFKAFLKGTVMGASWIDPALLIRNSIVAAGNSRSRELIPLLKNYLNYPDPVLTQTSAWSLKRIRGE